MDNQRAVDTVRRMRSDEEVRQIQAQYMADMEPLQNIMSGVLMAAITVGVFTVEGEFAGMRYDDKTQEQIDTLKRHMQAVTDSYKKKYPDLFRYC